MNPTTFPFWSMKLRVPLRVVCAFWMSRIMAREGDGWRKRPMRAGVPHSMARNGGRWKNLGLPNVVRP